MDNPVITLVADIVASREVEDRDKLNEILHQTLKNLNAHKQDLLSPYTLTLGDEIQAVFSHAGRLFRDAVAILAAIYPTQMRFSFGVGPLITPINRERAIGMDGPAFHRARDGIDRLKKTNYLFTINAFQSSHVSLPNYALRLISHNVQSWNHTRWKTLVMLYEETDVEQIAEHLNLTEQAIYKTIRVGALYEIRNIFIEIENLMNNELAELR